MRARLALATLPILVSITAPLAAADPTETASSTPLPQTDLVNVRNSAEPLQTLPAAVSLANREEIATYFGGNLEQLEFLVPGLIVDSLSGTQGGAMIALRGIGATGISSSIRPAVGLYLDGVPIGTQTGRLIDLYDLDEIAVVRGAQGVFRGSDNLGGTILLTRTRPTGAFRTDVTYEHGSYGRQTWRGSVDLPRLANQFAMKLSGIWADGGGDYMHNCKLDIAGGATNSSPFYLCRDSQENSLDMAGVTANMVWEPRSEVNVQYIVEGVRDRSATRSLLNFSRSDDLLCSTSTAGAACGFAANPLVPQTLSYDLVDRDFSNRSTLRGLNHTLRILWNDANHEVSMTLGGRNHQQTVFQDLDATSEQFLSTIRDEDHNQLSWDVRLRSYASARYEYTVGLTELRSEYDLDQESLYILDRLAAAGMDTGGAPAGASLYQSGTQKLLSSSIFGHLDYRLSDAWRADLGVRFLDESVDSTQQPAGLRSGGTLTLPDPISRGSSWRDYSYEGGLTYRVDPASTLYLLVSQGQQSGGFDDRALSVDAMTAYGPATATTYELGIKAQRLENRLRIDFATYQTKYRRKPETVPVQFDDGRSELVTGNLALADITGYELEMDWRPLENLQLRIAASRIVSKYDRFAVPSRNPDLRYDQVTNVYLPWAPRFTFSLLGSWSFAYGQGRVQVAASYRYTSDYTSTLGRITRGAFETLETGTTVYHPATSADLPIGRIRDHGIWNASIGYLWRHWQLGIIGRNLTNVRYLQNVRQLTSDMFVAAAGGVDPIPLATTSEYNEPRFVGFVLRYSLH